MRLKVGIDPMIVASELRRQLNEVNTISTSLVDETNMIAGYIGWVSRMEGVLRGYYVYPELDRLLSTRYWHLRDLMHTSGGGRRIPESIFDEARIQMDWMTAEADDLEGRSTRFGDDPSVTIGIVDANVFLHGEKEINRIPWRTHLPYAGPIRLVVPIRVVDELDERKFFSNNRSRARYALRKLNELIGKPNTPVSLGDGVSIESYVPPSTRSEQVGGDNEIVVTAEEIKSYSRKRVVVITRDYGMGLRAKNADLEAVVVELPIEES
jgi:hypothetical protein